MPRLRVPVLFVAATDKRLLIVRHGHGATMLAYREEGPKVTAAVRRFIMTRALS
jgi:hypothetical protein